MQPQELVSMIKGNDAEARGRAWQEAGPVGAAAIKPLAGVAADGDFEVSRAATRAMWGIVRHAGRPGAAGERERVTSELLAVLGEPGSPRLRSEVIWMLSEIAGDEAVAPLAGLLGDAQLREDARMALERMERPAAATALKSALADAPPDFRPNLACSLRHLGIDVDVACDKLKPRKATQVRPAQAAR